MGARGAAGERPAPAQLISPSWRRLLAAGWPPHHHETFNLPTVWRGGVHALDTHDMPITSGLAPPCAAARQRHRQHDQQQQQQQWGRRAVRCAAAGAEAAAERVRELVRGGATAYSGNAEAGRTTGSE